MRWEAADTLVNDHAHKLLDTLREKMKYEDSDCNP